MIAPTAHDPVKRMVNFEAVILVQITLVRVDVYFTKKSRSSNVYTTQPAPEGWTYGGLTTKDSLA